MATYVAVSGTFVNPTNAATPAKGTVTFQLVTPRRDPAENRMYPKVQVEQTLDSNGAFSVSLLATDDADLLPSGGTYQVTEDIVGAPLRAYRIEVPSSASGTGLNLADITPAEAADSLVSYALASDLTAHLADTVDAHDASAVSFVPTGTIAATTAQAAIAEVATDAAAELATHAADTTAVHGIADTSVLETTTGAQTKATAAQTAAEATAAAALASHVAAVDPHPGYLTPAEANALYHALSTDMATQAELNAHEADTTNVHGIADTSALETTTGSQAKVDAHVNDASAAHAASAISYNGGTGVSATDVEGALDELATEKLDASAHAALVHTAAQPVTVKDADESYTRPAIRFIAGSGATVEIADDAGDNEVEVTIGAGSAVVDEAADYTWTGEHIFDGTNLNTAGQYPFKVKDTTGTEAVSVDLEGVVRIGGAEAVKIHGFSTEGDGGLPAIHVTGENRVIVNAWQGGAVNGSVIYLGNLDAAPTNQFVYLVGNADVAGDCTVAGNLEVGTIADVEAKILGNRTLYGQDEGATYDQTALGSECRLIDAAYSVPGGTFAAGNVLEFEAWGTITNNAGAGRTYTFRVKLGASTCTCTFQIATSASAKGWRVRGRIRFEGANDQNWFAEPSADSMSAWTIGTANTTEDTSTAKNLDITAQTSNTTGTQSIQLYGFIARKVS